MSELLVMLSISGFSSEKSGVCCVCVYTTGLHREAEGRDSWGGDRGVGLGLHPAHSHYSKHDAWRPAEKSSRLNIGDQISPSMAPAWWG